MLVGRGSRSFVGDFKIESGVFNVDVSFPGTVSMTASASLHPCTDVVQLAVLTALLVIMGAM